VTDRSSSTTRSRKARGANRAGKWGRSAARKTVWKKGEGVSTVGLKEIKKNPIMKKFFCQK